MLTARRRRALWIAGGLLLAGLGGLLAWLWLAPPPNGLRVDEDLGVTPAPEAPAPVLTRLRGRVLLEALPDPAGPKGPVPEDMAPGTGPEGQVGAEPSPPPPGSCTAVVWRNAQRLADATCDAAGGFAVMLPALEASTTGAPLEVAVEMLVPGRLRRHFFFH